ncbi:glycosyltransferase [Ignicoccus islandicus]|nr:glycosyltransferase [Ignicoccus islandicus]
MRIGIVSSFPPMPCGIGEYAFSLSKALSERGHEVVVIATKWDNAPEEEVVDGVKVIRSWVRGSQRYHHQIAESVEELGPFDYLEIQLEYGLWPTIPLDSRASWLLRYVRPFADVLVSTIHTVRVRYNEHWILLHKEIAEISDVILLHHAIQEIALSKMIDNLEKTVIIPHGSETLTASRVEVEFHRPVLLLYGLLRRDKGLEEALTLIKKIREGTLILAGKPLTERDYEAINEVKRKLGKGRVVLIERYLSRGELGALIRLADYVLMPYRDYPNDYGISGALHTVIGSEGKPICSRVQRLIECWEVAKEVTFPVGNVEKMKTLIEKGVQEDVWGKLWRYAQETSWSNVALLREKLLVS